MSMYKHKYDKSDCGEMGARAEQTFAKLLEKEGFEVRMATFPEQMRGLDVIAKKNNQVVTFDCKAMKRISRADKEKQDLLHWVEIKNTSGGLGSLFGTADRISFETKDSFIIVDRNKLVKFVSEHCDMRKLARVPEDALYCNYSRPGRKDQLSLVKKEDLLKLAKRVLPKDANLV